MRIFDLISVGNIIIYIIAEYCIVINLTINIINTAFTLIALLQPGQFMEWNTFNKGTRSCWHGYLAYRLPFTNATPLELSNRQHKYTNMHSVLCLLTLSQSEAGSKTCWGPPKVSGLPSLTAACCRDKRHEY
jgi:hypothetical protein